MTMTTETTTKPLNAVQRLYRGQTKIDFIGRKKIWFGISIVIIVAGILSLSVRGFNLGIDFKGGNSWTVKANGATIDQITTAVERAGLTNPQVVSIGSGNATNIQVEANLQDLSSTAQSHVNTAVITAMADTAHTTFNQVSVTSVGPTWGSNVTTRALIALSVFFVLVGLYISFRFEPKMALAAFLAMLHDLLVTVGVYSIFNFQITPDTVVAVLTILGYSLYDTVVVFDRVTDNVHQMGSTSKLTYSEIVNLSMNQTMARSINTSLVAILPVLSVLLVGAVLLGATTLLNYGVALFVGLVSGAYSSIFIASPILAILKEREPKYRQLREQLATRRDRQARMTPTEVAQERGKSVSTQAATSTVTGTIKPSGVGTTAAATGLTPTGQPPKGRVQKKRR